MELRQEALTEAQINIARLQAQVEHQGLEIGELKAMIRTMGEKLDTVANTLTEARGGWKMMMLLGGSAATFGGAITWFVAHMTGRGAP